MADHTIPASPAEQLATDLAQQLAVLTRRLSTWIVTETPTLELIEQHVLQTVKDLAATLLAGLVHLRVPTVPSPTAPCSCGASARLQRQRPATVKTLLGPITVMRPYYLCPTCHHGHAPLDQQLDLCAGSLSTGLAALSALLGATTSSFATAASLLEQLTLLSLSPTTIRSVTDDLGTVLLVHEAQTLVALETAPATAPPSPRARPTSRFYVSLDGLMVHLHEGGWSECKLGTVYTTTTRRSCAVPEQVEIRGVEHSYVVDLTDAATFGRRLWAEAVQRGVLAAEEVVVIGDGAHWIWNLANDFFPGAVQIVDWYHASSYVFRAAEAIYGEGSAAGRQWAEEQQTQLWQGQVRVVRARLEEHRAVGGAVAEALTYYTNHQTRMDYPSYRARGLQIGSGSIESSCKHVLAARLKQAGMIWTRAGALSVATVRAWIKSGRWAEALQLRPPPRRRVCQERAAKGGPRSRRTRSTPTPRTMQAPAAVPPTRPRRHHDPSAAARGQPPAATHPWRRAWSVRRQRQLAGAPVPPSSTSPCSDNS